MSKENKVIELSDEKIKNVVGGSSPGLYSIGSEAGVIEMKTSEGRTVYSVGDIVTRIGSKEESPEEFYIRSISNNCEPGDKKHVFSTTYCFSNVNGTSIFFFTAFKNGNVVCNEVK